MRLRTTIAGMFLVAVAASALHAAGANMVKNGDFTDGTTGWKGVASNDSKKVAVVDGAKGVKALLLKRLKKDAKVVVHQDPVKLKKQTLYRLSATGWGTAPARLRLRPYSSQDKDFAELSKCWATSTAPFEKSDKPKKMEFVFDSGKKADSAVVSIYLAGGGTGGEFHVTDISLEEVGSSKPRKDETIIAHIGDSITITSYLPFQQRVDRLLQKHLEKELPHIRTRNINLGVDGEWIGQFVETKRYQKVIRENHEKIDVVIIRYGANDSRKYSAEEFKKRLLDLCDVLKKDYPGITVVIGTGTYAHGLNWGNKHQYGPYWQVARDAAKRGGYALVDVYKVLEKEASEDTSRKPKDLHPNAKGVRLIAEEEFRVLKPVLEAKKR